MNQAIREIRKYIDRAQKELDAVKADKSYTKEDIKDCKDELEEAKQDRINFWRDTFRADAFDNKSLYMADPYGLYQDYGHKFNAPTLGEIRQILDSLDEQHPGWDTKSAEPFYATLQENFPERVRKAGKDSRGKKQKKSTGCVSGLLLLVILIIVIYALSRN